jgi:acetylornithine deacetylase
MDPTPPADLLKSLVEINSINPSLVPEGAGEAEIAGFIRQWLVNLGIDADIDEPAPGRPSVIGRVRGAGGGRSLILNAHIDTVGVAGMSEPFRVRIEGNRLYGRGAYDMKAGLAACMLALADLRNDRLRGDVVLLAVSDEEHASIGVQSALRRLTADAAIVTEPTQLEVVIAHKGFSWHEVVARGRAAHGSRPDLGIDAIAQMGRVLGKIESLQGELNRRPPHPLLGHASVHASLIAGGQELSSYPETCTLQVERRTLPGESMDSVEAEFGALLGELRSADRRFKADYRTTLVRPPFSVSREEPIVQAVFEESSRVLGKPAAITGSTPWMDAAFLAQAGIPTVVIGPGGAGAHATEEWADLESVEKCRQILAQSARKFCR